MHNGVRRTDTEALPKPPREGCGLFDNEDGGNDDEDIED